ncbi:hypothetical protein A0H81_07870 [Grifola frondosa]|uniref:Uncharacterized protein n=1 Tax=Grifola frondosa TaxID=5627 RepID=A0A1C7M6J6_GRIFR|nr:hypothetical protein A0H81_07870 [Grifola frondosa]
MSMGRDGLAAIVDLGSLVRSTSGTTTLALSPRTLLPNLPFAKSSGDGMRVDEAPPLVAEIWMA